MPRNVLVFLLGGLIATGCLLAVAVQHVDTVVAPLGPQSTDSSRATLSSTRLPEPCFSEWRSYISPDHLYKLRYTPRWILEETGTSPGVRIRPCDDESGQIQQAYFSLGVTAHSWHGDSLQPIGAQFFGARLGTLYRDTKKPDDLRVYFDEPGNTVGGYVVSLHSPSGATEPRSILSTLVFSQ